MDTHTHYRRSNWRKAKQSKLDKWEKYYSTRQIRWDKDEPSVVLVQAYEKGEINTKSHNRVAVLGCGTGADAIFLAQQGFTVTAVDIAPTAIKMAQDKTPDTLQVCYVIGNLFDEEFVKSLGTFDLIFDRGCYHHLRYANAQKYVNCVLTLCPTTVFIVSCWRFVKNREIFENDFSAECFKIAKLELMTTSDKGRKEWSLLMNVLENDQSVIEQCTSE